jgi:hypothetical protein
MKKSAVTFLLPAAFTDGGRASASSSPEQRPGRPQGFGGGREMSGEWCEGGSGAGGPFYRRREGVRRGWAVASANHGARAGVTLVGSR